MKILTFAVLCGSAVMAYSQAPAKVNYTDHISPIFRNACTNCHNPDKKKAGLDLTTYEATMTGGESGPAIKPGNGDGSLLYKLAAHLDEPKMPPKGDKMSEGDLKLLKDWIAGFALENANSKPAQVAANKVDVAVVSLTRPDGPPVMPGDLPLEPFSKARGGTAVTAMAASPWAPLVAIGGQKQVFLYQAETSEPLGVLNFPEGFLNVLRFSRNAKLLLGGGGLGGKSGAVVLWDVATGERAGSVGHEADAVMAADISPDHQFVALGGPEKRVKIYQTKDGKQTGLIKKHTEWITAVTYSPDGKYLATADRNGGVEVWEAGADPKPFNTLAGHKSACTALAFMPGVLASAGEDGKVILWNVKEGTEIKNWTAHPGGVQWVEFSPDGRLATCGRDKTAKVWDQTGKLLATTEAFGDLTTRCALNGDRVFAADWTGDIRVFGIDGKKVAALSANPPGIAEQLALAEKTATEAVAALPVLQKAVTDAEANWQAEKTRLADAEAQKIRAAEESEAAKESMVRAEKVVAEFTAQLASANEAMEAPDAEATAVLDDARKSFEDLNVEIARRRERREKYSKGTPEYLQADDMVQTIKPEIARARQALDAAQAAVDESAKTGAAEARKKAETVAEQLQQAKEMLAATRETAAKQITEAEKAVAEADRVIQALKNPPAPKAAPHPKAAEAQKRLETFTAEVAKLREERAKFGEGTPEYARANDAVQAKKEQIKKAEEELTAIPPSAAPAPVASEAEKALAKAKAELESAQARGVAARTGVLRWKRAELFQAVFDARQSVVEKKAKYEELLATAKDAFRSYEMTGQAAAAAVKVMADGPRTIGEKETALASLKKAVDDAANTLAGAEQAVAAHQAELADTKKIEAEIAELQKQSADLAAEREKMREERGKFSEGTPEFNDLQNRREALRVKTTAIAEALAQAREKLAAKTSVPPDLAEAVKKAQLDLKLAKDQAALGEKALAGARKAVEDAKAQAPELLARLPQLEAGGRKTKAEAEKAATALAGEIQAAEAEAEKLRHQFEASKQAASAGPAAEGKG